MNELAKNIAAETGKLGAISFARFMELALYCPVYGYYEAEGDKIGRRGDFYTSVSVGSLFGELLAFRFAEWFEAALARSQCQNSGATCHAGGQPAGPPQILQFVEAGAHRGDLALDILRILKERKPAIWERLQYWILEPSERRRQWQQERLAPFGSMVRWAGEIAELASPSGNALGVAPLTIIFSNELLDSMPVHRLGWDARRANWFEWGVAGEEDRFHWVRLATPAPQIEAWIAQSCLPVHELAGVLPDGFVIEVCPAATEWWRRAGLVLGRGKLLAFDYGATADELLLPERPQGTLRAYREHRLSEDVLDSPGCQDLTAHVNFTAIERAGQAAGLCTEMLATQSQFLTATAANLWNPDAGFGEWTPARTRQFQTLTHPEHLGRSFRVLIQARD